jgi:hypothetical protein
MINEIASSKSMIASRGPRISTFQLDKESPDFANIKAQLPPPCVLVLAKGRGMRGVKGNDIVQSKLLQAWVGAMQPSSCCPSGSGRSCK